VGSVGQSGILWYVGRGSGIVAYVLLTASIVLGIALSQRWHAPRWPRLLVDGAHRWITITFYLFIVVHVVTILLDPFTHFAVPDVVVPFWSAYRPLWMSLGIIAAELALAIGATVWVRSRIGYRTWHVLHGLSYPIFAATLLHSIGTGTDTKTLWATALYGSSVVLVVGATIWRTARQPALRRVTVAASTLGVAALVLWSLHGPYAPGWAAASGTPKALLAVNDTTTTATAPAGPTLPASFHDTLTGATMLNGAQSEILLRGTATGTTPLEMAIELANVQGPASGQIQIRTPDQIPLCSGPIGGSSNQAITATCSGYGQQMKLTITIERIDRQRFTVAVDGQTKF
jgi:hypothetical protein